MKLSNIHQRKIAASPDRVGALIDSLASPNDALWPRHCWPRMAFDRPLGIGARGGHGPIRYVVEGWSPGRSIRFRFTAPTGFDGRHGFDAELTDAQAVMLRHWIDMELRGPALLSWPLLYRPLHDALIEDALTTAQVSLGLTGVLVPWPRRVKCLRWMLTGGKAPAQSLPAGVTVG
jgi:hypothetical protein